MGRGGWQRTVGAALVAIGAALALPHLLARVSGGRFERAQRQIAASSGIHVDLSLARGGALAAFANEYGEPALWIVATDGSAKAERLPVTEPWPRDPKLSPDGRYVVYRSFGDESYSQYQELFLYDRVRGRGRRLVAAGRRPREEVSFAAWSPDGRQLVYQTAWREKEWQFELHLVDLEAGSDRVLVRHPSLVTHAPSWSPDGARIAFVSEPDVWIVTLDGTLRQLTHHARGTALAPSQAWPDPPSWSPDGKTLAFAAATANGCYRLALVDVASGVERPFGGDECAMRPRWFPGGGRLAYLRLGNSTRTLWARALAPGGSNGDGDGSRGAATRIGFGDGLVYGYDFDAAGRVILVGQPADEPRALWRFDPATGARTRLFSSFDPPLDARFISRPESTRVASEDGLAIPLQVFPRTCGAGARGPALLWLHGGPNEDIAPRFYPEIQYLTARGLTVVAVNYRGSTGNGTAFRLRDHETVGQIDDVLAALRYTRARADVDPGKVALVMVSWSSSIGYAAAERAPGQLGAIVDWVGSPGTLRTEAATAAGWPPMLWLSGEFDRSTPMREADGERLRAAGVDVTLRRYAVGHSVLPGRERQQLLGDVGLFLDRALDAHCGGGR